MSNPVLVEITRGGIVESAHHGAVAVVDGDGGLVFAAGDIERPIFARSAIKGLQALPLVESGAAARFSLGDRELALACASHSGEPEHAETANGMLARAGLGESCLECGAHWPVYDRAARDLAAAGQKPSALHNNCSGKHAGFVCLAVEMGHDPRGYVTPGHPAMREVTSAVSAMTGHDLASAAMGIDGCSIPTYAIPLRALALGFARFATGSGLAPARAAAARRLRQAVANSPFHVAGTERFDTVIMEALREKAFIKVGAEGVYCAALPGRGLGIALKIDDGAGRAAETAMAALLMRFVAMSEPEAMIVRPRTDWAMHNWNRIEIGRMRAAAVLAGDRPAI